MFVRFSVTQVDEDSRKPRGVFSAAYALLDHGDFGSNEREQLRAILDPPDDFYASRAIFWFKSNAHKNISRVWELVYLLRAHDHHIDVYKCRRLSNISYEDEFQVAAFPSDKDGKISIQ
jgi:hypothetical protein